MPAVVFVLTGCVAIFGANSLVLAPIAPAVAEVLRSDSSTVMRATAGIGAGTTVSALFFARHIDRIGAWRGLRIAMAVLAVALVASALAPNVPFLVAAQVLAGLASGVAVPAIYSGAAAIAQPGFESRTIGIVLTGWTLSLVAGVSLSTVLADLVHWRAVYGAIALLAVVALPILAASGPRGEVSAETAPMPLEALGLPGIVPLLVACFAFMSAFYGIYGFMGDHLHSHLGRPLSANGLVALIYGLAFGSAALIEKFLDRWKVERLMLIALVGVAAVYVVMAVSSARFAGLMAAVFAWGFANHVAFNALIVRLTAIDSSKRGTIMGLYSAVTNIAVVSGTLGFGVIYQELGFGICALVAAGLSLVANVAGAWPGSRNALRVDSARKAS